MEEIKKLQEQYNELKYLDFPSILDRIDKIDNNCTSIYKEILIHNRANIYFTYSQAIAERKKKEYNFEKLIESALTKPNEPLRIFEPLEVQGITILLKQILSNTPKFVEKILEKEKSPDFFISALFTIPAVFSFFSTKEANGFAFSFYVELSRRASFDTFLLLVSPFFNSSISHVYSNLLFNKIFWKNFERGTNEFTFCQELINQAATIFKYLPEQMCVLLRMLLLQWKKDLVWKLLVRGFLFPQYILYSLISPYSYNQLVNLNKSKVKAVLYTIGDKSCKLVLPDLNFNDSFTEIPETFIPYKSSFYVDTILTITDIKNLISLGVEVPHHTERLKKRIESIKVDLLSPFTIHVFPKMLVPPQMQYRTLFNFPSFNIESQQEDSSMMQLWSAFEIAAENIHKSPFEILEIRPIRTGVSILDNQLSNSNKVESLHKFGLELKNKSLSTSADILEKLLMHKMSESQLYDWNKTCASYQAAISVQIASLIMQKYNLKVDAIKNNFWSYINNLCYGSKEIGIWVALIMLDKIEASITKSRQKELTKIEKRYKNLLIIKNREINYAPKLPSIVLKTHMYETIGTLQFANNDTQLSVKYILLFSFMEEIELLVAAAGFDDSLEKVKEILCFSFAEGRHTWIIRAMVILSGVLINNPNSTQIFTPEMLDKWRRFSAAFIQFISSDIKLVTEYGTLTSPEEKWVE